MRQLLIYLEHWYKLGMAPKARPVPLAEKPQRVWTLFLENNKNKPPCLPIVPQHNVNAFLEDQIHDWNFYSPGHMADVMRSKSAPCHQVQDGLGTLDYSSRAAGGPVWILLEYDRFCGAYLKSIRQGPHIETSHRDLAPQRSNDRTC